MSSTINFARVDGACPQRRQHANRALAFTAGALILGITGCASNDPSDGRPEASSATSPSTASPSATPSLPEPIPGPVEKKIDALTGGRAVELTLDRLPSPPRGFTDADLEAFAERALDILARGVDPNLNGKTPDKAFDYVFANQYPDTTRQTRTSVENAAGDYDWQWSFASLFKDPPTTPPRFLGLKWQVETTDGRLSDGTSAPQLQLSAQTAVEHLVPDDTKPGSPVSPVVVLRTLIIVGFKPQGGSDWWPSIGIQSSPLFGGKCAPINGAILEPATRPDIIREDLAALKKFISESRKVTPASSSASDIKEYLDKYCESR